MAEEERAELWRKRLDDIVHSDLTIEKWCEQNGTTVRQYGYWRKRLGYTQVKRRIPPPNWVAVPPQEPHPAPAASVPLTLRIAGAAIEVSPGFDPVLLRAVVAALESPAC